MLAEAALEVDRGAGVERAVAAAQEVDERHLEVRGERAAGGDERPFRSGGDLIAVG